MVVVCLISFVVIGLRDVGAGEAEREHADVFLPDDQGLEAELDVAAEDQQGQQDEQLEQESDAPPTKPAVVDMTGKARASACIST